LDIILIIILHFPSNKDCKRKKSIIHWWSTSIVSHWNHWFCEIINVSMFHQYQVSSSSIPRLWSH